LKENVRKMWKKSTLVMGSDILIQSDEPSLLQFVWLYVSWFLCI
jgi:hypothetical protein